MKIKQLHIENYKSLRNVDFELDQDINVFIGKNNSGKSNLIDALMFLSWLMKHGSNIDNAIANFGGYKELVFAKDRENKITFGIKFILSEEDISSLFAKLDLEPEISFTEFRKRLNKEVNYLIVLEERRLHLEEIHVHFNGKDVLYAQGSYRDGMYYHDIVGSAKDGIRHSNWTLVSTGGSSPGPSILLVSHSPIRREENLILLLYDFITSFAPLSPVRKSPERQQVLGGFKLSPDGSNLPQVLNSIASSNRNLFDKIIVSVGSIIEEVYEIRAPLVEGTNDAYISAVEHAFKGEEFTWKHIASGTKEVLYLITLLYTTPKGNLLMLEEPEIHLHADAIHKFLSLSDKVCQEDDKQLLITTHSPTLIDELPFEKAFTVVKESGETKVAPFREGKGLEGMLLEAGIPKSWILQRISPAFLLIVEGRDDVKIWRKLLEREGADPNRVRVVGSGEPAGGDAKAIEVGKFLKRSRIPTPFKIVLDSDNKKQEKEQNLKNEGFKQNEYHVLFEKEIEDYLLDPKAISGIIGKSEEEVNEAITKANGAGKEKLDNVFKELKLSKPDEGIKELLATRVDIPAEILSVINEIKGYLSA